MTPSNWTTAAWIAMATMISACSSGSGAANSADDGGLPPDGQGGDEASVVYDAGRLPLVDGGRCPPYVSSTSLGTPTASFRNDVMPILASTCGLAPCHGSATPSGSLFLGSAPAQVYGAIVNQASVELPSMNYVAPYDPLGSYLMHKIDGDQCYFDPECVGSLCGAAMPNGGELMAASQRDTVRRWIAQGARND